MAHRIVGLDLDGLFCNWNAAFARLLAKANGRDLLPAGWEHRDPDDFVCWNWAEHYGYSGIVRAQASEAMCDDVEFWYGLEAMPGTQEVLDNVNDLVQADMIDLYFITTRIGTRVKQQTEMWLIDRGIMTPTVIISHDKVPVIQGLELDFYIDDKLETMLAANAAQCPGLYLLDRPWNRTVPVPGLPTVYSVAQALIEADLWLSRDVPALS